MCTSLVSQYEDIGATGIPYALNLGQLDLQVHL